MPPTAVAVKVICWLIVADAGVTENVADRFGVEPCPANHPGTLGSKAAIVRPSLSPLSFGYVDAVPPHGGGLEVG